MGRVRRGSHPFPRANRRGRRPRRPAEACADVFPRVTTRGDSRCRQHPRRGQDPSLRTEPLTGAHATPPGRACPAPTVRRPGNGCPRKPRGRFHIPIRRAGCPHPAATSRCRQQQPLPSPLGEGGPAGPDEGQAPAAAHSRANRRARRPRRPAKPCVAANNSPCLPPWGKVAPQGRMRGRLPLPPVPGQTAGGGVPDAPENLAPTAIPRVTTRKNPPTQTCGPGMPGPYRAT